MKINFSLLPTLQNNTFSGLFVGQNIVTLSRVESTNTYLKKELSKSAPFPEGTVIMAEEQFAGRGQSNNIWISEPRKNLTFSILLNPDFISPHKHFVLNKAVCVAINDVLSDIIGPAVKIKWPNDIYVNNKKLGGILIENIVQGSLWKHSVVGIGINVNQSDFPETLTNVTSIKKILQHDYDLKKLLDEICRAVELRYLQIKEGKHEYLHQEYLGRLYLMNELALFSVKNAKKQGTIKGVTEDGLLEVLFADGCRAFDLKEITFLIP